MSRQIFDRVVVVDWSARATPATGVDSIWVASLDVGPSSSGVPTVINPSTRHSALEIMVSLTEPGRRTLLGVDFSLGFPAGTAAACGLGGVAWDSMWGRLGSLVVDDERNRNNRFAVATALNASIGPGAGPFWGCPPSKVSATLTSTKPDREPSWPGEWRAVEARLREAGRRPFSAWQLLGAGSVGGQSLVGIAALDRLRSRLGSRMAVWPFTTGLHMGLAADRSDAGQGDGEGDGGQRDAGQGDDGQGDAGDDGVELVVAEVWPSLWDVPVAHGVVKDAAQVAFVARRLAALDGAGELGALLHVDLDDDAAAVVVEEEGWVLGVAGATGPTTWP